MRICRNTINFAAAILLAAPAVALAQGEEQDGTDDEGQAGLERITVTAQRVEESLQEVPIAVSAIESGRLEQSRIDSVDDLSTRVPGLTIGRFNPAQPQIYIRGIGSTDQSASGDASVGIFVDGVYISRHGSMDLDFFDLERVEVLRGPQGTLYGKNVVGGAINYVTRPPSSERGARAEVSVGNFGRQDFRGLLEGPVSSNVNAKLAINRKKRDGYSVNATTGNDLSDEDSIGLRGQLHILMSDDLDIRLSADYRRARLAGTNRECIGEQFIFFPWFAPGSPFAASPCSSDPFVNEKTVDGFTDQDVWGLSATATWLLGWAELTSITAFRRAEVDLKDDFSGSDAPLVVRNVVDDSDQWTQELRLSGGDVSQLQWLAGYYFLFADIDRLENNDFSGNDAPLGLPPSLSFNPFYFQRNETANHAVFGQLTRELTDGLMLKVGARYTWEEKRANIRTEGFDPTGSFLAEPYDVSPSDTWSSFTPMVSLDYRFTVNTMAYASYSEGFKSGGFDGTARDAASAVRGFDEEQARQVEVGLKSQLFDNRLRLNLAAFHIDYTDLQVFQLVDGASLVVSNAADATSQGFEAEFWAVLNDQWKIQGSYAYLDASYDTFVNADGQDFSGNRLTRSPEHSYNISLNFDKPIGDNVRLSALAEYSYRSRIFYEPDNFPLVGDPALGLVNTRITLGVGDHWEFALWGENLADEVYRTNVIDGRGPFNLSENGSAVIGPPRMWGLTVGYRY